MWVLTRFSYCEHQYSLQRTNYFPKFGVYLVRGKIQGRKGSLWGLMNVGIRPTIHEPNKEPKVEVYFLDFFW